MLIPNRDLNFWNSDPKIRFWENWGPQIDAHSISRILIPNPDLDFKNFDPKIHFWANLGLKIQSCPFYLKIGTLNILRMLIPNPDLDF